MHYLGHGHARRNGQPSPTSRAGTPRAGLTSAWLTHLQRVAADGNGPADREAESADHAQVQRVAVGGRSNDAEQHRHSHACGHNVQRAANGAITVQRALRSTREDMEASRSSAALTRTAGLLRSQGKDDMAAKLEGQLDKSLPLPMQGTVAFANEMLVQQRHGRRYKLSLDLSTMLYSAAPHEGRKSYGAPALANGKYNFVVPVRKPDKIMASQVGTEHEEGHSALAKATKTGDGHVYWAGTAVFTNGVLDKWTNDSGHYRPTGGDAGQLAGITGGFPIDKYKNFDDPGGAG